MKEQRLEEIVKTLIGLKFYEWKSIERAVNKEFSAMSSRLELTDASRIQRIAADDLTIQ